jgi:D-alanyl-D-alanine dipeptidase
MPHYTGPSESRSSYSGGYHAAILSFLLPGTGQLFQGSRTLAIIFFASFAGCFWTAASAPVALIVSIVSGLQCLSLERSGKPFKMSKRYLLYLALSFTGFVLWFFAVAGEFIFGAKAIAAEMPLAQSELVDLRKVDFTIAVQMHFAGENNLSGKKLLPEDRCIVRKPVAVSLARVQESLRLRGLSLKALDCYHPTSLETKFLEWLPKGTKPEFIKADHPVYRGAWVEVTLVQQDGADVVMPYATPFVKRDKAVRGRAITGASQRKAKSNARVLDAAMQKEGFVADKSWPGAFRYNVWEQFQPSELPFSEIP